MRKLKFSEDSQKCLEIMDMLGDTTPVCLELFVSPVVALSGIKIGVPYFWGIQIYEDMVYGRDIASFINCIKICVKKGLRLVYSFSLKDLYYFVKPYFNVTNRFVTNKGDILNFNCSIDEVKFTFRCLSSISGSNTIELFAGIQTQWNRRVLTPKTRLRYDDFALFYKILTSEERFIIRLVKEFGVIWNIPPTLSGMVNRRIVENCGVGCKGRLKNRYLRKLGSSYSDCNVMDIVDRDNLLFLNHAFMGGYIGYNVNYVGKTLEDVTCYDFTSSYPARLVAYKYPLERVDRYYDVGEVDLDKLIDEKMYLHIMRVRIFNLKSKSVCRPLKFDVMDSNSLNPCMRVINESDSGDHVTDISNGVVSYDEVLLDICSVDWEYLREFYSYDRVEIEYIETYIAGYLPAEYINSMLELFWEKSKNKGNPDSFMEDMSKKKVNITWGKMASGFYKYTVSKEGEVCETDLDYLIHQYNNFEGQHFRDRTSCYQWAIFCTAYARRDLLGIVNRLGVDWIYSDSDSVFFFSNEKHINMINEYNSWIEHKLLENPYIRGVEDIRVKSDFVDKEYRLGEMIEDGFYKRFKFLKSKTYLCEYTNGSFKLRMSGCSNFNYSYLTKVDPFEWFSAGSYIPKDYCDCYTRPYFFEEFTGVVEDYLGVPCDIKILGGVARFPSDLHISDSNQKTGEDMADDYLGGDII